MNKLVTPSKKVQLSLIGTRVYWQLSNETKKSVRCP